MGEKRDRYGKYGSGTAGTQHHLYPKDWGDKRSFEGSQLNAYAFRDPKTGTIYIIHARSEEAAQTQAQIRGLRKYRQRGKRKK